MAQKFLAILWDANNSEQEIRVSLLLAQIGVNCRHLKEASRAPGFVFLCSASHSGQPRLQILANGSGLVFGTVFERHSDPLDAAPCSRRQLTETDAGRIVASGGKYLLEKYWGHYLAVVFSNDHSKKWIFRSPNCFQPCLTASVRGVQIYFSTTEDLARLGILRLTINWPYVAVYAEGGRVQCAETGLNEVTELQVGECHEAAADSTQVKRMFYWSAADAARLAPVDDAVYAERALRATVRSCVASWAAEHPRIVQRLSGGIDSSIVATCLRLAPARPDVTCINYYAPGAYGDEREYARSVALKNDFLLRENRQNGSFPLKSLLDLQRTESPFAYLFKVECDSRELQLARELGATARFTGTMGDMLLQTPPALPSAVEYLQRHGFNLAFLRIALQCAQLDRVSLYRVIGQAVRNGVLRPPKSALPGELDFPEMTLLTHEAQRMFVKDSRRFVHPWLHSVEGVPFGKFTQVSCLGFNSTFFNSLSEEGESDLVHPLLSEPVVELCLRIPTYMLMHSGWDRAMARQAFAQELPDKVRMRSTKGSMNQWVREMIASNAAFIRDILVDGILVKERILDRDLAVAALPGSMSRSPLPMGSLLDCVAAEIWSRTWSRADARRAAA